MKLAIGMPVFQRAWCLPLWFDSLEAQNLAPKEDITLCFAYSRSFDGSYDILMNRGRDYGNLMIYEYDLPTFPDRLDLTRFTTLAQLRNGLLSMARETDADYFLSWDNDILFKPDRLNQLFMDVDYPYACGALVDMGGQDINMNHPSVMHFPQVEGEVAYRKPWAEYPHDKPFKCDVIMAVKLMSKDVFHNTEYRWDTVGEDIGWCHSCEEQGYPRFLQPQARGIHLYDRDSSIRVLEEHPEKSYPAILEDLRTWYINT